MAEDVFKIFRDLELKAVGLDENTKKMQEGYFAAFRPIGLPIHRDDYANPYSPAGGNLAGDVPQTPAVDPKGAAPGTGSTNIDLTRAFAANVAKSQEAFVNTFALVDDKLVMGADWSVMPQASKVSDSWFAIINGANGINTGQELSDAMKKSLDDAKAKLADKDGNATPHYEKYIEKEGEYRSKVKAKNKAYADAFTDPMRLQAWPVVGKDYADEVDEALDRWTSLGFKHEIESALNLLSSQGIDPSLLLISRSKKRFQNSLVQIEGIGQIPYTFFSPKSWYDVDNDDGWTQYSKSDYESHSTYEASSTSAGGGVSAQIGLWSGGGSFKHEDTKANGSLSVKNLTIKFNYCTVDIRRPWLDTSLLNLKNWFMFGDYKKNMISDGTFHQVRPDAGEVTFLPAVVTSLILVKDVTIAWDDWESQWQEHTESNGGDVSVGVWCFTAKANYSHANTKRSFDCESTSEGLHIPGIQLLGYVSAINPASPALDSAPYMKKPA